MTVTLAGSHRGPVCRRVLAMLSVLTKRADFVAANKGLRNAKPGFVLLTRPNGGLGTRYGVTVTKKIGNAVVRNRMKRRFRELLRAALPDHGLANHDHVLIGRAGGVERDFPEMTEELALALSRARDGKGDRPRGRGRGPRRSQRHTCGNVGGETGAKARA